MKEFKEEAVKSKLKSVHENNTRLFETYRSNKHKEMQPKLFPST